MRHALYAWELGHSLVRLQSVEDIGGYCKVKPTDVELISVVVQQGVLVAVVRSVRVQLQIRVVHLYFEP